MIEILDDVGVLKRPVLELQELTLAGVPFASPVASFPCDRVVEAALSPIVASLLFHTKEAQLKHELGTLADARQYLDEQLGAALFERSARERRLKLTDAGKRLQGAATRFVDTAEDIRAQARFGRSRPVPLRIGVTEPVAYAWLADWLARVRREQPDLAFDLKVGTTDELDAMMVAGALDLAIGTRGFGYRAVERRALIGQPMVFVGSSARHDKPEYSLRELAAEGLLTFQMRSIVQQALHDLLRAEGLDHCRVDTVSSVPIMIRMVEDGGGIATLPRRIVELANNPQLRILRCPTALNPVPLCVSWRQQRNSHAVAAAIATLLAILDELTTLEAPPPTRGPRPSGKRKRRS